VPGGVKRGDGEGGIKEKSIVNCSQIRTVDEQRITAKGVLGNVGKNKMEEIEYGLKAFLGMVETLRKKNT